MAEGCGRDKHVGLLPHCCQKSCFSCTWLHLLSNRAFSGDGRFSSENVGLSENRLGQVRFETLSGHQCFGTQSTALRSPSARRRAEHSKDSREGDITAMVLHIARTILSRFICSWVGFQRVRLSSCEMRVMLTRADSCSCAMNQSC